MPPDILALVAITLFAATVNGAIGYGFSSLTVPVALIFYTNRVLNPSLVLIELVLNAHILWTNRKGVANVWRRVFPIVIGLLPGVLVGTWLVYRVDPDWVKFITYATLAPLIQLQAAGIRRPIRSERSASLALGSGIGVLYSVTTISGPPLALMFKNQGYAQSDFRAGLGLVRLAESSLTAVVYLYAGFFTLESLSLVPYVVPGILIGIPLGAFIIGRVSGEVFRRVCSSFDTWIVAFGMARVLQAVGLVPGPRAYLTLAVMGGLDLWLLRRFLTRPKEAA
jgi:hypothetical protein